MRLPIVVALCLVSSAVAGAADLREGFAKAIDLDAELRGLIAQRGITDARRQGSQAVLPGAPSISSSWRTTTFTQRTGYQEFEIGAEVPIWLPGEARALRGSVDAQEGQIAARIAQARLRVAAEVRDAYWTWAAATAERDAATARVNAARTLERDLARQVVAGQVARADLLLATADLREAEALQRTAAGAARDAAIAFRALTGTDPSAGQPERPAPPPTTEAALQTPPAAAVARTAQTLARAEERLAQVRDRPNPAIFGALTRERDESGAPYIDRVTVGVRIPFAYAPQVNECVAAARAEAAAAEAALATVARTLAGADARARAQAEDAAAIASLADDRHRALAEQAGLAEAAYRAGNFPFAEVIRARAALAAADAQRRRARVEGGRAASQINQILGLERGR